MNTQLVKNSVSLSMTMLLTLAIMLTMAGSATAQETEGAPGGNASAVSSQGHGPADPVELEAFLDDLFARQMAEYHIAGAAVSLVKDGKLFFAKGYGYADLAHKIPVDAEQTIFGIGSVGKLFTWTAVMQLVEQGKLDLDTDINRYLDFRIPDTYPQPITLKHLMTHTSGFENRLLESAVADAQDLVPAREWLVSHLHARVRPSGEASGYSNYNAMLAGYIVARVAGQPYDQYIQTQILDPLGMTHTTARSPIPPALRAHASVGYTYEGGAFQPFPAYTAQPAALPSGMHHASATDMARFMIAHLQDGRHRDASMAEARILKETTVRQMHTTLYTPDPHLLGVAYGFFDFSDNGQHTLGHSGELPPTMQSLLLLLPDHNLGLFVVYNSQGGNDLTLQHLGFQRAFFDHYFPAPAVAPRQPSADAAMRSSRFAGSYRWTMGARTTIMKIIGLFGTVKVSVGDDGTLLLSTPYREWRFVEVEPLYFRQVDGPFNLAFREDDQGRITYMFTDSMPQFAFEKLAWYETLSFAMAFVLGCVLLFLSMIPIGLIGVLRERRRLADQQSRPRGAGAAYWIMLGIAGLNLLFLVGAWLWGMPSALILSLSWNAKFVLGLGVLSAILTIGALVYTVLAWKNRYWGVAFRAYYTLATVAAVAFIWFLNYWKLLGWRY
jgi:CubicO group peptidase (beta-lactamase class C family)